MSSWYVQALAYHNEQLQASAFREQYDPESFEDLTEPKVEMIHKACIFLKISSYINETVLTLPARRKIDERVEDGSFKR